MLKRIVITSENYYPIGGGIQQYIRTFSRALIKRGIKVDIICQSYEGDKTAELWGATVHYTSLFSGSMQEPFKVIANAEKIAALINSLEPDIVYANNHNSLAVITACKQLKVPVVYGFHGVGLLDPMKSRLIRPNGDLWHTQRNWWGALVTYFAREGKGRRWMLSHPLQTARSYFSAVYPAVKQYAAGEEILNSAQARLANSKLAATLFKKQEDTYGIPLMLEYSGEFGMYPVDATSFKKRFGLDRYVLVPGRLHMIKGQEYVVRAINDLPADVKVVFAGTASLWGADKQDLGGYAGELKQLIEQLAAKDRFVFTGRLDLDEIRAAYSGAAVTVVPSVWFETFGYVVIEALACESPVVVTENCGAVECVNSDCAIVVPRCNPGAIAKAINEILPKSKQMGKAGRQHLLATHSVEQRLDDTLTVFERAISK
jgi:glycosyltransferase involved in cell wall biosynthesis